MTRPGPVQELHEAARAIPCPACQVPAGRPCTVATDVSRTPVAWHHTAREDAAWDAIIDREGLSRG